MNGRLVLASVLGICMAAHPTDARSYAQGPDAVRDVPTFVKGEIRGESFRVVQGERAMALSNVRIVATTEVVIDGLLLAKPGVTIEILAPKVTVRGAIRAGDGADGVDVLEPGGDGGDILLRAAEIVVDAGAFVRAGRGGDGGFGASGGNGGSIRWLPSSRFRAESGATLEAGSGGSGGPGVNGSLDKARNGGDGGEAGSVGPLPETGG